MNNRLQSQVLLYQAPDGRTRLEVRMQDETVWLTQAQMAELFQTTQQNVSLHIRNIYEEGELTPEATHKESLSVQPKGQVQPSATAREFLIVRQEGSRQVSRSVEHYNLDVIISVGYRVKSLRGTQFRIWATQRLRLGKRPPTYVGGYSLSAFRVACITMSQSPRKQRRFPMVGTARCAVR